MTTRDLVEQTTGLIADFIDSLPDRPVRANAGPDEIMDLFGGPVPEEPAEPEKVVAELAERAENGLLASAGPRFFGFVIGGSLPAALAADLLATGWDQNAGLVAAAPAAAIIEDVAGRWVVDLLGLPAGSSFGFTTGATMANFTGLAAGRHHVLGAAGWDVEAHGLQGGPELTVVVGEERHITVDGSLRLLGLGDQGSVVVPSDGQGRMTEEGLRAALVQASGPTIVVAQAGNVNTGGIDPLRAICDLAHERGAWVHVDGAFGLWGAASPKHRDLLDGHELADSWSTDAHKWLNVPYDCGITVTAHPESHKAAMGMTASYLIRHDEEAAREPMDWTPEFSRRARGLPVYAAIRSLGRSGVADLVERCCAHATRFATRLGAEPGVDILNDVRLNQVLVRFDDDDATTDRVVELIQRDGTLWLGGSRWRGRAVMRISVSNWSTTEADVDRSCEAILRCLEAARG